MFNLFEFSSYKTMQYRSIVYQYKILLQVYTLSIQFLHLFSYRHHIITSYGIYCKNILNV